MEDVRLAGHTGSVALVAVEPKPAGWSVEYGAVFGERGLVGRYHLRPAYPQELVDLLGELSGGGRVLDAGCGTGELARRLAPVASPSMPSMPPRRCSPSRVADSPPNVTWIHGRIEDAELSPPYALAVCGDSIHWFDWERALPRLAELLADGAPLAIVQRDWMPDELWPLSRRCTSGTAGTRTSSGSMSSPSSSAAASSHAAGSASRSRRRGGRRSTSSSTCISRRAGSRRSGCATRTDSPPKCARSSSRPSRRATTTATTCTSSAPPRWGRPAASL